MSFVKKAIKKVVKTVKKVVKSDIFKYVAIGAAIFFTAGVAAGGFAAFSGVSSIGGFFTAVGQTIATGASAIAGGLGMSGTSNWLAGYGGQAAASAGLAGAPALTAGVTAAQAVTPYAMTASKVAAGETIATGLAGAGNVAAAVTPTATQFAAMGGTQAGAGFLSKVGAVMNKKVLGDLTLGKVAASMVTTGVTEALKGKDKEKEFANGFVGGGLARGGGERDPGAPRVSAGGSAKPTTPAPGESTTARMAQGGTAAPPSMAQQEAGLTPAAPAAPAVAQGLVGAGQMAQGASPGDRLRGLIAQRGPVTSPVGDMSPGRMALTGGTQAQQPQEGRRFTGGATQIQYQPKGLV